MKTKQKTIKIKHKLVKIFPFGEVYVPVIKDRKNFPQYNPTISKLHNFKIAFEKGIGLGELEAQKEELFFLQSWYGVCSYKSTFKDEVIEHRIEWLKKKLKKKGRK